MPQTSADVTTIKLAMAAAGPISPASSRFTIATEASVVLGD